MRAILSPTEVYHIENRFLELPGNSAGALMELVGNKVAEVIAHIASKMRSRPAILILAGKGNNGADGYSSGIALLKLGFTAFSCQIDDPIQGKETALRQKAFISAGGAAISLDELHQFGADGKAFIIIDAIYGIGLRNEPSVNARMAIQWANGLNVPIVAIDIPSGIDGETGVSTEDAIRADATVACHFPKRGFFFNHGRACVGTLEIVDLGLPAAASPWLLIEEADIAPLLPTYALTQDKFSRGTALIVGGSPGLMGALSLTSLAVLSSGAGYCTAAIREDAWGEIGTLPYEAVKKKIPDDSEELFPFFTKLASHEDAIILGPGMGRDSQGERIFLELLAATTQSFKVIDADGLFWLSQGRGAAAGISNAILTPHRGEALRLLGCDDLSDQQLIEALQEFLANKTNDSICVLKGRPTYILQGGSDIVYVMNEGSPGMATAGSGDVLAGIIGALVAQKTAPLHAAILGTWLHAKAGEVAARANSAYCSSASALISALPEAFSTTLKHGTDGTFRNYMPDRRAKLPRVQNNLQMNPSP